MGRPRFWSLRRLETCDDQPPGAGGVRSSSSQLTQLHQDGRASRSLIYFTPVIKSPSETPGQPRRYWRYPPSRRRNTTCRVLDDRPSERAQDSSFKGNPSESYLCPVAVQTQWGLGLLGSAISTFVSNLELANITGHIGVRCSRVVVFLRSRTDILRRASQFPNFAASIHAFQLQRLELVSSAAPYACIAV